MTGRLPPLSSQQNAAVQASLDSRLFLEGPAGCGKTTAAVERMLHLMDSGVPGNSILVLLPQRVLAAPYEEALRTPGAAAGGAVTLLTVGGLARRMLELFFPLVAEEAGFANPHTPPTFLTLETAQYYMAHLARPLLEQEAYFDSLVIDRNRLYSQIIDNLNKAAMFGFPHTEIGERLRRALGSTPEQVRIFQDAQDCANRFRSYCLEHSLLDFSLQLEIFVQHIWSAPLCREYLLETYQHLIADNLEEQPPVAHELLTEWLPQTSSALLIYDWHAGFRRFLGAAPERAYALRPLCDQGAILADSFVQPPEVESFSQALSQVLLPPNEPTQHFRLTLDELERSFSYEVHQYYPQMLDWISERIAHLIFEEGLPPGEIAVLSPFLSDALRYSLSSRLELKGIPVRSHRPSRSLREEPATQCLLTLAALAHPEWSLPPSRFDFAYALMQALSGMDLVRAQLLAQVVYRLPKGQPELGSFEGIEPAMQIRITYSLGERYQRLRLWLADYQSRPPDELDVFLSRLFGELLSQPGFGFHANFDAADVTARLVESVQKFRWGVGEPLALSGTALGREYMQMVQEGVLAAVSVPSWQEQPAEAVFLAPAYTFVMQNRPVSVQFWLDAGSRSWFERIDQPVTHPYVLYPDWLAGTPWTQLDEERTSAQALHNLVIGLLRRCRREIVLGISQVNEQGYESRGPLLSAFDRLLRQAQD